MTSRMREALGPGPRGQGPGPWPQPGSGKTQRILLARATGQGYGFSIRGGAEHKLGIYVSEVERGSEAHLQGLQVRQGKGGEVWVIGSLVTSSIV